MSETKILPVVVSGQPQFVSVTEGTLCCEVAGLALGQAAYGVSVLQDWELRDCDGELLSWGAFVPWAQPRLFLNQRAGVGA